jgi:hypothetical protein
MTGCIRRTCPVDIVLPCKQFSVSIVRTTRLRFRQVHGVNQGRSMGAWGAGLYDDDEIADLKSSIGLVAKVPVSGERLLEILLEGQGGRPALNDENGPAFWLAVADQFERRGVQCPEVTAMAFDVIASGADLRDQEQRGMEARHLKKCWLNLKRACARHGRNANCRLTRGRPTPCSRLVRCTRFRLLTGLQTGTLWTGRHRPKPNPTDGAPSSCSNAGVPTDGYPGARWRP